MWQFLNWRTWTSATATLVVCPKSTAPNLEVAKDLGQIKVFLGEATGIVGCQGNVNFVVGNGEIGVVASGFGGFNKGVDKGDRG